MAEMKETAELAKIKERIRAGKINPEDIRKIEGFVRQVEEASKALRAAMIE